MFSSCRFIIFMLLAALAFFFLPFFFFFWSPCRFPHNPLLTLYFFFLNLVIAKGTIEKRNSNKKTGFPLFSFVSVLYFMYDVCITGWKAV